MSHSTPLLLDLIFFIIFLVVLLLFLRRFFLKRKTTGKIYRGSGARTEVIKRREIQEINAGAVIVPTDNKRTSAHYQKYKEGNALIDAQKMDEAILIFSKLVVIPEETETASISLGTCYNLKGQREEAMKHYQRSLDMNPENYNALLGMASVNYHLAHYPTAVVYYKKANALRPDLPDAYWGQASAYHMMGEKKLSSDNAKIFIKLVPGSRYRSTLEKMIID